jgi:RNA-directed DNA polymerase
VAGIDVHDFFGSISKNSVSEMLRHAGYGPNLSESLAGICTLSGFLPQGAPTSPVLSNSYLYKFDEQLTSEVTARGLRYTRYADDIALSGDRKADILGAIAIARELLRSFHLRLSDAKTRVVSRQGQQRVTGLIVNKFGYPPRKFRRELRAACHKVRKAGNVSRKDFDRIRGSINYLKQFEALRLSPELTSYVALLTQVTIYP